MKRLLLAVMLTGILPSFLVAAESGTSVQISKDAQAVNFTQAVDVGGFERFSMQVDYVAVRPATSTVAGGKPSSGTLVVTDYAALNGQPSTTTITLVDGKNTSAIDGACVYIKGHCFQEGVHWNRLATSTMTMASLELAIENFSSEYSSTVSSNVITVTAGLNGTYSNGWAVSASTGVLSIPDTTFNNGQEAGYFMLNYVTLTEGADWNAETSSGTTAGNIVTAINANSTLSPMVTASTPSLGVIYIVSDTNGLNAYPISVSNTSHLTPTESYLVGGVASDISVADDTFYEPSHGFSTGLAVLFSTTSNSTAPTGLTRETTYYAIPVDANYYKLASSAVNASAGTDVDITALASGGNFDVKPLAFVAGSAGFDFRGSNDGTTFYDLTGESIGGVTVSSVTYSANGGDLWNFTSYPYRYLRFNFTGPTSGGLDVDATMYYRRE